MASDDEKERLDAHIPVALKERLRHNDETITDQLVEALELYLGEAQGDSRAAIERQIQRYQEQKAKGEQMVQNGRDMVQEAEQAIEQLERKLESMESTKQSYEEDLDDLLTDMEESNTAVFEGHGSVERIASDHGKAQERVLDDLKARSDLHKSHFTEGPVEKPDDYSDLRVMKNGGESDDG